MKWTVSALAVETGFDRRVVAERLSGVDACESKRDKAGRETRYYWGTDAFPALYGAEAMQLSPRDARESAQARKLQLEIAAIEGRTVNIEDVVEAWNFAASQVVQRAQGLVNVHPEIEPEIRASFASIAELPDVLIRGFSVSGAPNGHGADSP